METIHRHFSKIARRYMDLRITDSEPILFIKEKLQTLNKIKAADVGCGTGRYDLELFRHLEKMFYLTCIDSNQDMLDELTKSLNEHKIKNFKTVRAPAKELPLEDNSLDAVFTFNAVHHFKLLDFLKEASRSLQDDRYLFIYTRLRSQNKRNIWGRFFPKFSEKENRLYELNELKNTLKKKPNLELESIEYFKYKRTAKLEWLKTQAVNHHYSTFYLYDEKEFIDSLDKFQESIKHHYKDMNNITWNDENIMFVIRKKA